MNILHVTYDLRDRYSRDKTTAVKRLIDCNKSFADVQVIDIVRVQSFKNERVELKATNHLIINSFGLPYGIFFKQMQNRAFKKVINAVEEGKFNLQNIDLIHAHKLTFDGFVGYKLSKLYHKPFIITLRQTDISVLKIKIFLRKFFMQMIRDCNKIIYLIPQMLIELELLFGKTFYNQFIKPKAVLIPNPIDKGGIVPETRIKKKSFLTILIMEKEIVRRKNIKRLLKSFKLLDDSEVKLNIIGDGAYKPEVEGWVNKLGLRDCVNFLGKIENSKIDKYYAEAEAFLLPSLSESFGMVYAEALQNGTPIMYSRNCLGFDGFFENVGIGVNPKSIVEIKDGILKILDNSENYRKQIKSLRESGELNIFNSDYITTKYQEVINDSI
jgi:glycosyltransferase involved in cell wall biosynthesis